MEITTVILDNLDEEKRFSELVSELFPDNENFRNLSSDLQRFLLETAVEDGYVDDSYVRADGYNSYFQYYYPVAVTFCDDEYDDVDFLNQLNCVDNWYWMCKVENLVNSVSVSEFEEMLCGGFGITLGYLSRLTVAGRTPSVAVVDEEDGDASVEWGFKNGNGERNVRMNVSRSGKNDNWRLSFVYCAEPHNYDIDLNVVLTDKEEFVKLFAFVSARIEKILNSWG